MVRCCIRQALFLFMTLICYIIPCISRWRTLTRRKSFLVWDGDLVIDVDFCLNVPALSFGGFGIHRHPNFESGEIVELL